MNIQKMGIFIFICFLILAGCSPTNKCLTNSATNLFAAENEDLPSVSLESIFNLADERDPLFRGKLSIELIAVEVNYINGDYFGNYKLEIHGEINNTSDEPLVVRRMDDIGFYGETPTVIFINNPEGDFIPFFSSSADSSMFAYFPTSQNDFISLRPHECLEINWSVNLPDVFSDGEYSPLAPGDYELMIEYFNPYPGYIVLPEDLVRFDDLFLHMDEKTIVDLDAWVGKTDSNFITFIIPGAD